MSKEKGLYLENINKESQLFINPDNVFWGIVKKDKGSDGLLPDNILDLYKRKESDCTREMNKFRFDVEPTAVYIDPTERCNANCPYCYVPAKVRENGRSMTERELYLTLNKILEYFKGKKRKPVIIFHASEPLLVKDIIFKAIAKYKDRFFFGIQTNAILLQEKDVEFIKKHNVSIGISLDAPDAKTNNRSRYSRIEGGNFQKAVQCIQWFKGYRGLNVITTITKLNVAKLPELVRFLHGKGVECVLLNPVRLTQKNSHRVSPDVNTMAEYFLRAVEEAVRCSKGSKHKIIVGNFANVIISIIAPTARRLMCDISPCGGGRCFLTITAKGDMIPCGEFIGIKGFSGGNVFTDSLHDAMESAPFKRVRARIVEKIEECNECIFRNICGAPCPAELHALGNMYKKSVFCDFYKKIIRYAFNLIAKGDEKDLLREEGFKNLKYHYRLD